MKILVFPKDSNPYGGLLYSQMINQGCEVVYLGQVTPFPGVNIFLIPIETVARRMRGARIIHVHWVAPFCLPGPNVPVLVRRAFQTYFLLWLRISSWLGMKIVWTAHNVLPHDRVFANDIQARVALVSTADLVIVHSSETLAGLSQIGAVPRRTAMIPHGPFDPAGDRTANQVHANEVSSGFFRFLFVGRIKLYKGIEELLAAFEALPPGTKAHLTVAGQCQDPALLSRLRGFASHPNVSMAVGLERLPDSEISRVLLQANIVVLPFKAVTTSGSAILAISHGKPVIIPESAHMIGIPDSAAIRYDGTESGLAKVLERVTHMSSVELNDMSEAAFEHAHRVSWEEIAARTMREMSHLLK